MILQLVGGVDAAGVKIVRATGGMVDRSYYGLIHTGGLGITFTK